MRKAALLIGILMATMLVGPTVAASDNLLIYTSVPIEIMTRLQEAFHEAHPDIRLDVYRAGTGIIASKIAAEMDADNVLADLVWVADYTYLEDLKEIGMLYRYLPQDVDKIGDVFVDQDGYYGAGRVFTMVIAYNTNLVDDPPSTWRDLLDPKWRGEIVSGNPEYSGSNVIAAAALGLEYGLSYFRGLRENEIAIVRGNSEAAAAVIAGEYFLGLTLDNVVRDQKSQGLPIDLVYPEDGPIFIPSPVGILSTSDRLEAAQTFVDYIASVEGQQALAELGFYLPVRHDVPGPEGAPSLAELVDAVMPFTVAEIQAHTDFFSRKYVEILAE